MLPAKHYSIAARVPLRISLGGGGTDVPWYYEKYQGYVIAATINKFVTVYYDSGLVVSDIKPGTGLGWSGAKHVAQALLKPNVIFNSENMPSYKHLAEEAAEMEKSLCGGIHDAYSAAYGGANYFCFFPLGVSVTRFTMLPEKLSDYLLLFDTGITRSSRQVYLNRKDSVEMLNKTKDIGLQIAEALRESDFHSLGELMHRHWMLKRSEATTNPQIDQWYQDALNHGAIGGKIAGAGGGGYMALVTLSPEKLRKRMKELGLTELKYDFWPYGAEIVVFPEIQ